MIECEGSEILVDFVIVGDEKIFDVGIACFESIGVTDFDVNIFVVEEGCWERMFDYLESWLR